MKIKNWSEFQHFKDRTPPWIKLYRYLLDDPDWHALSGDEAKTLIMLWLIASEDKDMDGKLPPLKNIAFRLRISETKLKQELTKLSHWLICDDINMISERYQHDTPETEAEERKRHSYVPPIPEDLFKEYSKIRKAKKQPLLTERMFNAIVKEASLINMTPTRAIEICCENGWVGFKADWVTKDIVKPYRPTQVVI